MMLMKDLEKKTSFTNIVKIALDLSSMSATFLCCYIWECKFTVLPTSLNWDSKKKWKISQQSFCSWKHWIDNDLDICGHTSIRRNKNDIQRTISVVIFRLQLFYIFCTDNYHGTKRNLFYCIVWKKCQEGYWPQHIVRSLLSINLKHQQKTFLW